MFIYLFSFSHEEVGSTKDWVYESSSESDRMCIWQKHQLRKVYMDPIRPALVNKIIAKSMIYKQCMVALIKSRKDDTFVCFDQETGLILNDIILCLGIKRKIIVMGWLVPFGNELSDEGYMKRLRRAANNNSCRNITNYIEGKNRWIELINPSIDNFRVIHDVVNRGIGENAKVIPNQTRYCFVGGVTNRNWDLSVEIARYFPSMRFVFVSSMSVKQFEKDKLPQNVEIKYDLQLNDYYMLLSNSYVCLVPLLDSSPSGLLNIIRAAQYRVLCISSMNPFTEIYYPQSEKWLLNSTFDEWMICLERITDMDESEYKCVAEKLEDYVTANFSNEYGTRELKQTMEELYLE